MLCKGPALPAAQTVSIGDASTDIKVCVVVHLTIDTFAMNRSQSHRGGHIETS